MTPTADILPLDAIRIVLVRTSHPGNIGSAARAMKNMGLRSLALVAPKRFPDPEATALASGADDVLAAASVHASLPEAIGDCVGAYALSARLREWGPENFAVREAAAAALADAQSGPIAFVFGNEASGLTNEELLACQHQVRIPTDPAWSSINLSQAVQVVAYELRMAATAGALVAARAEPLATIAELEGLYGHLEQAAEASGFLDPANPGRLRERFRRLFARARTEREEVNIIRGLLKSLSKRGNPNGE
ncbi:MAG: RNA methyltransferase [Betaproteobacteria bacterium]